MIALIIVLTFLVLLLAVLVAGLLRSHADILRSLHELGAGVGDPAATSPLSGAPGPAPAPVQLVSGPGAMTLGPAPPVAGLTPRGDARAVAVDHRGTLTLLGFLSSGCQSCAGFWEALGRSGQLGLPEGTRVVIVTKGPELEITPQVRALDSGLVPVVMSTEAWHDYEVPGSPFFVLVDGTRGEKIGQGVASHVDQLVDLVRRAELERGAPSPDRTRQVDLDGPAREAANDQVLRAAGIAPGDPSLYPRSFEDVFPYSVGSTPAQH